MSSALRNAQKAARRAGWRDAAPQCVRLCGKMECEVKSLPCGVSRDRRDLLAVTLALAFELQWASCSPPSRQGSILAQPLFVRQQNGRATQWQWRSVNKIH